MRRAHAKFWLVLNAKPAEQIGSSVDMYVCVSCVFVTRRASSPQIMDTKLR